MAEKDWDPKSPEPKLPENDSQRADWVKSLSVLTIVTAELLGLTGAGLLVGYWIGNQMGGSIWFRVVGGLMGMSLAFYQICVWVAKK
jgi:F0F1-type ATP synthase assembly protein I